MTGPTPVNLAYADHHKNSYLSISGTARTSQDREKLRELWSMFTEAWLPQGPDGEDVVLVTVEPEEAKLWDSTSSNLVYAGKVLKAVATQTPPDGGRIEQVHMGGGTDGSGDPPRGPRPGSPTDRKLFEDFEKAQAQREEVGRDEDLGAASLGGPTS